MEEKIEGLFEIAYRHLKKLKKYIKELNLPINSMEIIEMKEAEFDAIAFRFAKLQSITGEKLFREILNYTGYSTDGKSFIQILAELEKEGILKIDYWNELREVRNIIAHEYPDNENELLEAVNLIMYNINYLENVLDNLYNSYIFAKKIKNEIK